MTAYHIYTGEPITSETPLPLKFEQKDGVTEKYCICCGRLLPISEFEAYEGDRARKSRTGYALTCNDCKTEWRKEHPKPQKPKGRARTHADALSSSICEILASHHEALKDDPERLPTDFLKSLIGGSAKICDDEGGNP